MENKEMMPRLALILAIAALAASCASVQTPIHVDPVGESARTSLLELELELLEARIAAERLPRLEAAEPRDAEAVAAARALLRERLDSAGEALARIEEGRKAASGSSLVQGADPDFEATLAALRGERLLLGSDRRGAGRALEQALALAPDSELALLLASRLEPDPEARLAFLDRSLPIAAASHRLEAERGSALLALGRPAEALASFDLALAFLPEAWLRLRGPERELAWARRDEGAAPVAGVEIGPEAANFRLLAAILRTRTGFLDGFPGALASDAAALQALRSAGSVPEAARPGDLLTRADAAIALWKLLHRGETAVLTKYSQRYAGKRSPVPDLEAGGPAFDAALGLVEAEIMELPDGRNFLPEAPASGLELDRWARAAWSVAK